MYFILLSSPIKYEMKSNHLKFHFLITKSMCNGILITDSYRRSILIEILIHLNNFKVMTEIMIFILLVYLIVIRNNWLLLNKYRSKNPQRSLLNFSIMDNFLPIYRHSTGALRPKASSYHPSSGATSCCKYQLEK